MKKVGMITLIVLYAIAFLVTAGNYLFDNLRLLLEPFWDYFLFGDALLLALLFVLIIIYVFYREAYKKESEDFMTEEKSIKSQPKEDEIYTSAQRAEFQVLPVRRSAKISLTPTEEEREDNPDQNTEVSITQEVQPIIVSNELSNDTPFLVEENKIKSLLLSESDHGFEEVVTPITSSKITIKKTVTMVEPPPIVSVATPNGLQDQELEYESNAMIDSNPEMEKEYVSSFEQSKIKPSLVELEIIETAPESIEISPTIATPIDLEVIVEPVTAEPQVDSSTVTPVTLEPVGDDAANTALSEELLPLDTEGKKQTSTISFALWQGNEVMVASSWIPIFNQEQSLPYFQDLSAFLAKEYEAKKIQPSKEQIFKCFEYTDFSHVKVVILSKLPYYRKDQADGLAFSTRRGMEANPTTSILIKEAMSDVNIPAPNHASLESWAKQGVLLLNAVLTAPSDRPAAHAEKGWLIFTSHIVEALNQDSSPKVFILWGEFAKEYGAKITNPAHTVLTAPNPSPLSAANGFYGSKPFSTSNAFLTSKGIAPIDWTLGE